MNRLDVIKTIESSGVIAIMRNISRDKLLPTVDALWEGGIRCIEVTANTEGALPMVAYLTEHYEEKLVIGAGTVIDGKTAREYIKAGARFLLSPSIHREVIDAAREEDIVSIPGAYTPTEIINGYTWGGDMIKLFPAVTGGITYIKQIQGPFPQIPLLAVGGITLKNAEDFIRAGCAGVGVGSSLVDMNAVSKDDFDVIRDNAGMFIKCIADGREVK